MSARKRSGVVMSMSGVRRSLAAAAIAVGLATGAAACGGDDESEQADAEQAANQASSDKQLAAIKTYLLEHTERLKADTAAIRENAEAYYKLAERLGLRLRPHAPGAPRRGAGPRRRGPGELPARQPGLRGDGGRGGRRARAGRLRRDHRRRRRRLGPGERRAVQHQDARTGARSSSPATSTTSSRRRPSAPIRSSRPRGSSPTSTATARSSSARRCRTRTSTSPPRATSRSRPPSSTRRGASGARRPRTPSPRSSS